MFLLRESGPYNTSGIYRYRSQSLLIAAPTLCIELTRMCKSLNKLFNIMLTIYLLLHNFL